MREILKSVKEKLVSKYLKNSAKKNKKFNTRLKARIRRNKQIINKNNDKLYGWVKGAE